MATQWLIPNQVEILRPPSDADAAARGGEVGYDILYPVRPGEQEQWTGDITHIFLRGAPRALRPGGRVYLKAGREVFWSAPVLAVSTGRDRVSEIDGTQHGRGPSLVVDLTRGEHLHIDAATMGTPDGATWHNRQGLKYVTPGCTAYVKAGPAAPTGAGLARSAIEIDIETALHKNLPVDRDARRIRIHDGAPRNTLEVDICIPDLALVIEYDGPYWHRNNTARDTDKTRRLLAAGLRVIRIRDDLPALDVGESVLLTDHHATPDDIAELVRTLL